MNTRPNIIYILADDQGYGDVGCFNPNCKAPTPVLDGMARDGMRFTDSHTSSAVCTPTRYSILTGRYNWRSRLKAGVLTGESPMLLEDGWPTVASFLQENGYWTACIGKWHLGLGWQSQGEEEFTIEDQDWDGEVLNKIDYSRPVTEGPNDFGFNYSFIIPSSLDIPPYVYLENGRATGIPSEESKIGVDTPYLMRRGMAVPGMKAEDVLPTFKKKVLGKIRERSRDSSDRPFFIYFPLSAPHTPIVPTSEYRGRTDIGLYGDFVTQIDAVVGEVLSCLEEEGVAEETLVIFTSDNGASPAVKIDELKEMGHDPNYPWRGHKADIYEGGHRTPFIARWPGFVEPGSVCRQTICTTDLFATVSSIVGGDLPEMAQDSHDLTPLLRGQSTEGDFREITVHHSVSGHFAVRSGKWKLLEARGSGGWSYPTEEQAAEWDLPPYQLYDMEKDPGESTNLAGALPEKVDELREALDECRAEDV